MASAKPEVLPYVVRFSSQVEEVYAKAKIPPNGYSGLKFGLLLLSIAVAFGGSLLAPPPPKICGTLHGPSITAPQLRLPDGRPVSYSTSGVERENARYKVVVLHDYGGSRLDLFPCTKEKLVELGVYMVSFDRAGYGESHPFPHRSIASEARDIENLADQLKLGRKFHVLAIGVGSYAAWGCIQHIPQRLAGVAMVAPVANFWWPGVPSSETGKALRKLSAAERSTIMVAHYCSCLLHQWTRQSLFPSSNMEHLNQFNKISNVAIQQGEQESIHKDLQLQFGSWDLTSIKDPSPVSVHLWQTENDPLFPSGFREWAQKQLQWARFHTVPGETHALLHRPGLPDTILSTLLGG